jgi:hypothetical protein
VALVQAQVSALGLVMELALFYCNPQKMKNVLKTASYEVMEVVDNTYI